MGFFKNALGVIGDAATGGLASGIGSCVGGLFGGGGLGYNDQKKLMKKQHEYELANMDYQAKLNEEMAQRNQERQNEYFGMTAEYNSAKNQKQRLEEKWNDKTESQAWMVGYLEGTIKQVIREME